MNPFTKLAFYLPIAGVLLIDPQAQDAGLWGRYFSLAVLTGILLFQGRKQAKGLFTTTGIILLGLLIWPLAGMGGITAWSEFYGHTARFAFLAGGALAFAAAFAKNEEHTWEAVKAGGTIALIIAALSVLPDAINAYLNDGDIYSASGPLFTHKNFASATMLLWLPFAYTYKPTNYFKYLRLAGLGLGLLAIILLRTRGVWLGLFAIGGVALLLQLKAQSKQVKPLLIGLGAAAALIVGLTIGGAAEKIFNTGSVLNRVHYWNAAVEMFTEHPVTGVGGGHWKIHYPNHGLQGTNQMVMEGVTNILRPHNDFLWMLSETGLPGALLFVGLLIWAVYLAVKQDKGLVSAMVITGFAAYGLFEFPLERLSTMLPFAIALGWVMSKDKVKLPNFSSYGWVIAIAALGWTALVSGNRQRAEHEAKIAVEAFSQRNPAKMEKAGRSAQNPFFEMDIFNTPMKYFEALGILGRWNPKNPQDGGKLKKAEQLLAEALEIHPYHLTTLNQMGDVQKFKGNTGGAINYYDQVLQMSPRHYRAAMNKAEVYFSTGNTKGALDALNMVSPKVKKYPKYPGLGGAILFRYAKGQPVDGYGKLHKLLQEAKSEQEAFAIYTQLITKK